MRDRFDVLHDSSSGGIFSAIADAFIDMGGCVCGAELIINNGKVSVEHRFIDDKTELKRIQGSKYVQSSIEAIYAFIYSCE